MKFREMLKLYKDGTLDAPQRELVETEIEKHEAISDYLYEASEIPELENVVIPENAQEDNEAEGFAKMVKSAIRRAFIKMGVVVGTAILAIVLTVIFVLPNVVSKFYYDPNEVVGVSEYGIETTRMELDISVFTELFLPYNHRDTVIAEEQGYGEYHITIPQTASYDGRFTTVAGRLERNKLTLYDPNLFKFPTGNAFVLPDDLDYSFSGTGAAGPAEEAFGKLQELDENKRYTAYFSFDSMMDYESFYEEFGNIGCWCAVYDGSYSATTWGFYQAMSGRVMSWDEEAYPVLSTLGDEYSVDNAEMMETHFISMLKYMRDNPETREVFCESYGYIYDDWDHAIMYVEENGMQIYGFVVTADKETILELSENENVSYVYTTPAQ